MLSILPSQFANYDQSYIASINGENVLLVQTASGKVAFAKASEIGRRDPRLKWSPLGNDVIAVTPFQKGFLACCEDGTLVALDPGKPPLRLSPPLPKSLPHDPLQRFWISQGKTPTLLLYSETKTHWNLAQIASGKWVVQSHVDAPIPKPPPRYPHIVDGPKKKMRIDLPGLSVSPAWGNKIAWAIEIASADPTRRAFVFNEHGEGGSHVIIVKSGRSRIYRTEHIEASLHQATVLVSPNTIVSYSESGFERFSLDRN